MALGLPEAITQLADARSPRRRAAAKRLRALADPVAGPALLDALRREIRDPRSWETQYQMIMALATCGHQPALPLLRELALKPLDATMVYVALGDGIVRLGRDHPNDPAPLDWCLSTGNDMLADGALRAVAMLRLILDEPAIDRILNFLAERTPNNGLRFWPAAAAAGWNGPRVNIFLTACASSPREDVADAAKASLEGRYKTYRPL
ncbi:hypothetical protein ACWEPN_30010 [Nonomuraea wenchangensis]